MKWAAVKLLSIQLPETESQVTENAITMLIQIMRISLNLRHMAFESR